MKFIFSIYLYVLLATHSSNSASANWIDQSNNILLPPEIAQRFNILQGFSFFWWNMIVIDNFDDTASNWKRYENICSKLKQDLKSHSTLIMCQNKLEDFSEYINEWSANSIYREPAPSINQMDKILASTVSKMSLVSHDFIHILRNDPFQTHLKLIEIIKGLQPFSLSSDSRGTYLPEQKIIIIPILLNYEPSDMKKTQYVIEQIKKEDAATHLIGPHQTLLDNKNQVEQDTILVSIVGFILMGLLCLYFTLKKNYRILIIYPILLFAIFASALLVILVNGSIHGLTLGFGSSIIGLAFDYAFHVSYTKKNSRIWKSNLYGLLTTIAVLLSVMLSSLPVLKQMMLFTIFGLCISFVLIYFIDYQWPKIFILTSNKKIDFYQPKLKLHQKYLALLALMAILFVSLPFMVNYDLSMKSFDHKNNDIQRIQQLIYKKFKPNIAFTINQSSENEILLKEINYAQKQNLKLENILTYRASNDVELQNFQSWQKLSKQVSQDKKYKNYYELFKPFFSKVIESPAKQPLIATFNRHLINNDQVLSVWRLDSSEQLEILKSDLPNAITLQETGSIMSNILKKDIKLIAPISFLFVFIFLLLYYKKVYPSLLSLVPLAFSIITIAAFFIMLKINFTFIAIISLLIIYGMSVDYGIFATDLLIQKHSSTELVANALAFSGISTLIGCLPLILATHQVLFQFGITLTLGVAGTLLGTFFFMPIIHSVVTKYAKA